MKRDKQGGKVLASLREIKFKAKIEETIKIRNYTHVVGYFDNEKVLSSALQGPVRILSTIFENMSRTQKHKVARLFFNIIEDIFVDILETSGTIARQM